MPEDTAIEKKVKSYVWNKIGENVYLDLATPSVVNIKHVKKSGSINLGILWANVLQHENNYPVQRYLYRKLYDTKGDKKLQLKADDVTLTLFLGSGTLMIQGNFVINWFLERFEDIMDRYDLPKCAPQMYHDKYKKYQENWMEFLNEDREKLNEAKRRERLKENQAIGIDFEEDPEDIPSTTKSHGQRSKEGTKLHILSKPETVSEKKENEDLDTALERLKDGRVEEGPTFIYPLWKDCLQQWFSDPAAKVYIATPFLDLDRMIDICQMVVKHKLTANLEALFVQIKCDHRLKISDIRRSAHRSFHERDQLFVEYKVYNRMVYPYKHFQTNFIAKVKDGIADVLVTSASFHGDHFVNPNLDSVTYSKISEEEFTARYLKNLVSSQLSWKDIMET